VVEVREARVTDLKENEVRESEVLREAREELQRTQWKRFEKWW